MKTHISESYPVTHSWYLYGLLSVCPEVGFPDRPVSSADQLKSTCIHSNQSQPSAQEISTFQFCMNVNNIAYTNLLILVMRLWSG